MPDPKKLFTQEFRDEAVRLAQTSGRSRREVAADLGIGLSTLRNWIDRRCDRQMEQPPPDRQEDMAAELKRLRRENEVLYAYGMRVSEAVTFPASSIGPRTRTLAIRGKGNKQRLVPLHDRAARAVS
jgi:transposase